MRAFFLLSGVILTACTDVGNPSEINPNELITTVELSVDGGVYRWVDLEGDGDPLVDPITLASEQVYPISVRFLNEATVPAEDVTEEVRAEGAEHQVFFGGNAPSTFTYEDEDANGLPLGLSGSLSTRLPGEGSLQVVLRHLPEQGGVAVKVAGLEVIFATEGLTSLPGETDVDVEFALVVE